MPLVSPSPFYEELLLAALSALVLAGSSKGFGAQTRCEPGLASERFVLENHGNELSGLARGRQGYGSGRELGKITPNIPL